jgi:calcineurin-like phosphoesterase family protein
VSNVFFISDTHFFHHKVLEFVAKDRPFSNVEEMNEAIVDRWNKTVTKRDTVYHLGDVCFGHVENLNIIRRLRGNKKLILGNHDKYKAEHYLDVGFGSIHGAKPYDGYLLTHVPIHPDQFYRWKGNVHGHLHSSVVMKEVLVETGIGSMHDTEPDPRYWNVSCEQNNLTPIAWEELKRKHLQ